MATNYTQEQIDDIKKREQEGLDALKKLNLTPACQIVKENMGNDLFADRLYPYLQDTKFTKVDEAIKSPFVEKDEPSK